MTVTADPPAAWALDLFVDGQPVQKGSMTPMLRKGTNTPIVRPDNEQAQKEWTRTVHNAVRAAWIATPTPEAVRLRLDFVRRRRKSSPKSYTEHLTVKPDGDKLERATWDALTGLLWVDDAQVVDWSGTKREAEPGERHGVRIRFAVIPPAPRPDRTRSETPAA